MDWKVVLVNDSPVWPISGLIRWEKDPSGKDVATIICTKVLAPGNGFLELTLVPQGTSPELTLLLRQDQILLAMHVRGGIQTGFAESGPKSKEALPQPGYTEQPGQEKPMPTTWRTSSRPSTPVAGDIPGTD